MFDNLSGGIIAVGLFAGLIVMGVIVVKARNRDAAQAASNNNAAAPAQPTTTPSQQNSGSSSGAGTTLLVVGLTLGVVFLGLMTDASMMDLLVVETAGLVVIFALKESKWWVLMLFATGVFLVWLVGPEVLGIWRGNIQTSAVATSARPAAPSSTERERKRAELLDPAGYYQPGNLLSRQDYLVVRSGMRYEIPPGTCVQFLPTTVQVQADNVLNDTAGGTVFPSAGKDRETITKFVIRSTDPRCLK